jgi:hypothetical protein
VNLFVMILVFAVLLLLRRDGAWFDEEGGLDSMKSF